MSERSEHQRTVLLGALCTMLGALIEADRRLPAATSGGVMLRLHPDGSGAVEIEDPVAQTTERLFNFESRQELARWILAPDAERVALEAAEKAAREALERATFAKLDLLFVRAGGVQ